MAFLRLRKTLGLGSALKIGSEPETIDQILDIQLGTVHELNKPVPGMWLYPKRGEHCCIYRVPNSIRRVNSEAYTPQLVIIGPLHHSLKSQALKSRGDITNTKLMGYLNMERHKKSYLEEFAQMLEGEQTIDELRRIIKEDEERIRASYSESTAWIESSEFVDIILHDSVFIMEFFFRTCYPIPENTGDTLMDEPCLHITVEDDLILLENQLPFFILEKLFDPIIPTFIPNKTFREVVIAYFGYEGKVSSTFRHLTDLSRLVHVEQLPELTRSRCSIVERRHMYKTDTLVRTSLVEGEHIYNADKLDSAGVKFKVLEDDLSLSVHFENGCLEMHCLTVDDKSEMRLRNLMALEQCHYPYNAHVCQYIMFLDRLIDTHKDVELLVDKGIIKNWIGEDGLVAEMVNKLNLGIVYVNTNYYKIAVEVNAHYRNPFNRARNILKRVYFSNVWKGTVTVAATILLLRAPPSIRTPNGVLNIFLMKIMIF